jgi:hypothetical protein
LIVVWNLQLEGKRRRYERLRSRVARRLL